MKKITLIINVLLMISALTMTVNCFAIDSTGSKQQNIVAMNRTVETNDDDTNCTTTEELQYTVSITNPTPAYPACPPNMMVKKINFRTARYLTDVNTFVSVRCCKNQIEWRQVTQQPGQPVPPAQG